VDVDDGGAFERMGQLERENLLLREEVRAMHGRLEGVRRQLGASQAARAEVDVACDLLRKRVDELEGRLDAKEKQHKDMFDVLRQKDRLLVDLDDQVAGLRAEAEAARASADALQRHLTHTEAQRDQYKATHMSFMERMNASVADLKEQLGSKDAELAALTNRMSKLQRQLDNEAANASSQLTSALASLEEKTEELARLDASLKSMQASHRRLKQEHADYKARAARVIQEKDRALAALRTAGGSGDSGEAAAGSEHSAAHSAPVSFNEALEMEISQLTRERTRLQAEVQELTQLLADTHMELDEEREMWKSDKRELVAAAAAAEEAAARLKAEAEEERRQMTDLRREKDAAIASLQRQLAAVPSAPADSTAPASSSSSHAKPAAHTPTRNEAELEARLHALSEHLIQKQAALDTLTSEKAALLYKVEGLVQERNTLLLQKNAARPALSGGFDMEAAAMPPMPPMSSIAKVKSKTIIRAANYFDNVFITLGRVLRQSPLARLLTFLYVMILHLLVFVVIATITPEQHSPEQVHEWSVKGKDALDQ